MLDTFNVQCPMYNVMYYTWTLCIMHLYAIECTHVLTCLLARYASCTAGLVFEVDVDQLVLIRVWSLYPVGEDPIIINSLSCDDQYCVTGCGDGTVRVWPLDFSMIVMETELDNPAMFVGVASGIAMCTTQVR